VFFNPSLRTLASFQAGDGAARRQLVRHHAGPGHLATGNAPGNAIMSGAAAEHIREGIPVLASYCDASACAPSPTASNLRNDLDETTVRHDRWHCATSR
jgi:hypothetical protein